MRPFSHLGFFRLEQRRVEEYVLVGVLMVLVYALLVAFLPAAVDWQHTFLPAARSWRDPYSVTDGHFHNPPWVLLFLIPFGLAPEAYGWAAFVLISLLLILDSARALHASKVGSIAAVLAPPVLAMVANGQIDALALWGAAIGIRARESENPWLLSLGLLLMSVKPQVAGVLGLLLWLQSRDKIRPLIFPVGALFLSFLMYGWWPASWNPVPTQVSWNISIWPWGIPMGILMGVVAYQYESEVPAFLATPFLVPYLALHSLVGVSTLFVSKVSGRLALAFVLVWWLLLVTLKMGWLL
jgi:hypothetical protein